MEMLVEPLGLTAPVAGFNGGVLVTPALAVIETHTLAADVAEKALDLIEADGLDAWLYTPDTWLIRKPDAPHVAREAWTVKFEAKVVKQFARPRPWRGGQDRRRQRRFRSRGSLREKGRQGPR